MLQALVACADVWRALATANKGNGKGHVLSQPFVHLEHVDPFDTKDGLHFVVADDILVSLARTPGVGNGFVLDLIDARYMKAAREWLARETWLEDEIPKSLWRKLVVLVWNHR